MADNYDQKIHPKTFCGEVEAGDPPRHKEKLPQIVDMTREQILQEVEKNYEKVHNEIVNLIQIELNKPD